MFSVASLLRWWGSVATTAAMTDLHVGDTVLYRDRVYVVRGISRMGATLKRAMLEDQETHDLVEAPAEDLRPHDESGTAGPR